MPSNAARMTDYENELCEAFEEDHYGHDVIYTFHETGIGHILKITCLKCGSVEDATDYESW